MRTTGLTFAGLLVGFVIGIVLSDLLVVQFHNVDAAKGLPLYLATAFAIGVPLVDRWRRPADTRRADGRRSDEGRS
jgi:hypothetical protein